MGRTPCCSGEHAGLKRGPWTHEEDQKLKSFLLHQPNTSWRLVPQKAGLVRCGKSCRLRWMNYLRPDIRRGNFTEEEENLIIQLHCSVGNKWSIIASHLPGRTDNEIKNLWNTKLRKLLVLKGINPITHQPLCNPLISDYVKQWVKSIENMLIVGLATSLPNTPTTPNNSNSNGFNSLNNISLPSLLPEAAADEGLQQSPLLDPCTGTHSMKSSSFVDENNSNCSENYSDNLLFGENSFQLPGNFSYLRDEFGESLSNSMFDEGLKYWD